ncbi:MAG: BatD family protein [Saprospiraceae bacterium]|nr:BatD family protein [Saprospiraceae bacterium]
MKQKLILFSIWLLPLLSVAQASFEASTDARQVVLNGYFTLHFTLKNAEGEDFTPPSFHDFIIASGPSRSMSTTIINGKVSKESAYSYTLQPKKTGRLTIGSASIRANGRTLRTDPITIEVLKSKELPKSNAANRVFLRAELSSDKAIIGQQIVLDYKLYTAIDIDSYSILQESDYQGFYAQDLRRFDTPLTREVVRGVQYVTKILKRVALFPQQAGELKIAPLQMELAVLINDNSGRDGFLFNRPVQRLLVQSDEAKIEVASLPENPPASFTGAVGNFNAQYSISRNEASTDDVISLRLSITGDGDIKRVQAPALTMSDSFEIYDPKVLEENTYESPDGKLTGRKEVEYLLLPKKPGSYQLQPAFSYFDPETGIYEVLDQNIFNINIRQGSLRPSNIDLNSDQNLAQQDIRFIKLDTKLYSPRDSFWGSTTFWTLTILPFLFLGGILIVKRIQNQQGETDATQLKIKRARQEALRHLQVAEKHLQAKESRAFFDEVSKALLGYVCDKLQIPRSALTKENVREKLISLKVENTLIDAFMHIIQTCEVALFSGQDTPTAMNETYQQAVENIAKIETFLGK